MVNLTCRIKNAVTYNRIKAVFKKPFESGELKGILGYTKDDVISSNINGNTHSSIFDAKASITLNSNFIKLISWYNNK
jgi:glyceraldehyde 3-phosphate dehydrogenase